MSRKSADALPSEGNNLVIVAKIDNFYHARIFNRTGNTTLDKGNNDFSTDAALAQKIDTAISKEAIDKHTQNNLIQKITSRLVHTPLK
jgi:hypothetical protein